MNQLANLICETYIFFHLHILGLAQSTKETRANTHPSQFFTFVGLLRSTRPLFTRAAAHSSELDGHLFCRTLQPQKMATGAKKQDMPPPGGYRSIPFVRNPAKVYFSGMLIKH